MSVIDMKSAVDARAGIEAVSSGRGNRALHIAFAATFAAFVVIYSRTLASLAYTWAHDGTFEYAFLIFPVCAVLVWAQRPRLHAVSAQPRPRMLVPVLGLCVLWLAGALAEVNVVQHFTVVAMVPLLVYSFYGPAVTRILIFPLAYMFFAVPFGDFMVGPLQDITAHLSVLALKLTSVPVFMSERIILTPASAWHVAEACSGVKFFIATTAFGILYAYLFYRSLRRRLIFVACALVVPIIANGLRVFFTILIGEHFGLQYATGTDHLIFGWQFFGTVLVLLFLAGWPWHEFDPEPESVSRHGRHDNTVHGTKAAGLALVAILVLAFAPGWHMLSSEIAARPGTRATYPLPSKLGGHREARSTRGSLNAGVTFVDADQRTTAYYGERRTLRLDYARYDGAATGNHELITGKNRLFDPAMWTIGSSNAVIDTGTAARFAQHELHDRSGNGALLLWYVYDINGRTTTSRLAVKAWQAWYALTASRVHSSVLVMTTRLEVAGDGQKQLAAAASDALDFLAATRSHTP